MFGSSRTKFGVFCFAFVCHVLPIQARVKSNTEVNCDQIQSQTYYSMSDMAGVWYGIEILEHTVRGRPTADSCIRMEIKELDSNNIELIWRERNFEVVYKFAILNPNSRGVWTSIGSQTVSATNLGYEQFAGNVYVLKASESNIVLTFCSKPHVLYSVVLTKTPNMHENELRSIHAMVSRFGAHDLVEVKKYCRNRAANTSESLALVLFLCLIGVFTYMLRGR